MIPLIALGIGSALASLVGTIASGAMSASAANKQTAVSKDISEKNLEFQKEAFAYNKQLNATMMQREDNAYQRAVTDAKAAGLSPLAITGGASASAGSLVSAPQQQTYNAGASQAAIAQTLLSLSGMAQDVALKAAQVKNIEAQTQKTRRETENIDFRESLDLANLDYMTAKQKDDLAATYADLDARIKIAADNAALTREGQELAQWLEQFKAQSAMDLSRYNWSNTRARDEIDRKFEEYLKLIESDLRKSESDWSEDKRLQVEKEWREFQSENLTTQEKLGFLDSLIGHFVNLFSAARKTLNPFGKGK